MAAYLKSIDPYEHLVSTSQGEIGNLWYGGDLDFSQSHPYGTTDGIYGHINYYEGKYSKPHVVGEFGFGWQGPNVDGTFAEYERELHMGLWRGMFSPTPILPLTWWWEHHQLQGEYFHFQEASDFLANMLINDEDTIEEISVTTSPDIEEMGLKAGDDMFVWLRNDQGSTITNVNISIPGVSNGTYDVKYYNTWTGVYDSTIQVVVTTGTLQTQISSMADDEDIACWITKN
jgi:hypothetical protein